MRSSLSVCGLYASDAIAVKVSQCLTPVASSEAAAIAYSLESFTSEENFLQSVQRKNYHVDCLILEEQPRLQSVLEQLKQQAIFFPAVVVLSSQRMAISADGIIVNVNELAIYHAATVGLMADQIEKLGTAIDQAIAQFIQLSPVRQPSTLRIPDAPLKAQQMRLAEKLKARLGYLGIYYKRNPQNFLRHMSQPEREELLQHLKSEYREIVLSYFNNPPTLNEQLDNFVNVAFFADVSVTQVVEIHMNLMDEFSKQLKLEGRNDDILQDYRLTLIDVIAHLCEMYRRSIPRES